MCFLLQWFGFFSSVLLPSLIPLFHSFQEVFHDPALKIRRPKQVFTGAGASGILINDLVRILGDRGQNGVEADSVEDNIFQWNVRLSRFEDTPLGEDLARISELYGYDFIELQLDFSMDLYPFFPPLVKVRWPTYFNLDIAYTDITLQKQTTILFVIEHNVARLALQFLTIRKYI